ncbi:MAG TPA: sarcosine oxidase subunit gamma family protein [Dongiaceae bacterium]|jgi:sarcosine oxidase subunit gamma
MVEVYHRRSALSHFGLKALASQHSDAKAGIVLSEIAHRAIINFRGNAEDPAFTAAVRSATGVDLPVKANTVNSGGENRILWLGPNEWWLVAPSENRTALIEQLTNTFSGQHTAIIDVSESRTVIGLAGSSARDLLARGVSLDLHPRVFGPGQCAQTSTSKANVLLHQTGAEPSYEIYILKSFADYLWRWMSLTAEDFGLAIRAD